MLPLSPLTFATQPPMQELADAAILGFIPSPIREALQVYIQHCVLNI
jgi:hypothetical protein